MSSFSTEKWEVQLRKGCVELATLATLWPGRLYGLEILRRLEHCAGLTIAEGTIYPLLGRLERSGLIEAEWVETGVGHPRKYYTLTTAGAARTRELSRLWFGFVSSFEELLRPVREPRSTHFQPRDGLNMEGLRE
ncbi:MAG: PadR family transcriptional regulator [Acidobacteriota bacterium]|nr:PadR family transcriptional regulator [Acidobacteriota bacterium]